MSTPVKTLYDFVLSNAPAAYEVHAGRATSAKKLNVS